MEEDSGFIVITRENVSTIREKLSRKEGGILIAKPGPESYRGNIVDACLDFFAHPLISPQVYYFVTNRETEDRGGVPWQTNWEDDRNYFLCRSPLPSKDSVVNSCRELFERLQLDTYEFRIGFQSTVGGSLFPWQSASLYVLPGNDALRQALTYGLRHVINQRRDQGKIFMPDLVEKMVDYAINDLKDNKIFKANVSAGVEADALYG